MKKALITTAFSFLLLISCIKNEEDSKVNIMQNFKLDLSEMDIDFYKPYVQNYKSEIQRDSIVKDFSEQLTEPMTNSDGTKETGIIKALVTVSKESKSITFELKKTEDVDYGSWKDLGICKDAESLSSKMIEIIAQNPSSEFGIKRDLSSTEINLYYKE